MHEECTILLLSYEKGEINCLCVEKHRKHISLHSMSLEVKYCSSLY